MQIGDAILSKIISLDWQSIKQKSGQYSLWLLPVCLALAYFCLNPFRQVLISNKASLTQLTAAQKANIQLAARALNGFVLAPGQTFSFNKVVGPRTVDQGYIPSPSYLGSETPKTYGGGICLLSSLLYKCAIDLDMVINERTAHTRTTQSIPPGYDATVWYGQNDLKFTNNQGIPLIIAASSDDKDLTVNLVGAGTPQGSPSNNKIKRIIRHSNKSAIDVIVLREQGNQLSFISHDYYLLPQPPANIR